MCPFGTFSAGEGDLLQLRQAAGAARLQPYREAARARCAACAIGHGEDDVVPYPRRLLAARVGHGPSRRHAAPPPWRQPRPAHRPTPRAHDGSGHHHPPQPRRGDNRTGRRPGVGLVGEGRQRRRQLRGSEAARKPGHPTRMARALPRRALRRRAAALLHRPRAHGTPALPDLRRDLHHARRRHASVPMALSCRLHANQLNRHGAGIPFRRFAGAHRHPHRGTGRNAPPASPPTSAGTGASPARGSAGCGSGCRRGRSR